MLELSADHPIEYDAWDLDEYSLHNATELIAVDSITVVDRGPLLASAIVTRTFGESSIEQTIVLRAGSARIDIVNDVAWHENEKVLKVAMPVDVHASTAACEIQYGHVHRPRHTSTSWDAAKFEVCAHRWIDVSESDYGVALLNDCKYGHDVQRGALRLTLLRAPNFPDPNADRGDHHFTYSLFPHLGGLTEGGVIAEAAALNQPIVVIAGDGGQPSLPLTAVTSSDPRVVVTAVKLAEDGSGDVVVRCYESSGARVTTTLMTNFATTQMVVCDFLERALAPAVDTVDAMLLDDATIDVTLRPFQIATFRLS